MVSGAPAGNMRDGRARAAFCAAHGIDADRLVTAEQVHGTLTVVAGDLNRGSCITGADGLITTENNLPLAIYTADCVPVFFVSKNRAACGVVHAGWRGLAGGIIRTAVLKFEQRFNIMPGDLMAAIGPHIQKCCYEVGAELRNTFSMAPAETHLDMNAVAVRQLKECGVNAISSCGRCSGHETDLFFSYRRQKTAERMMSLIML
ncbi:MAG: hypothetical protein A2219_02925 [Elusimicrobia bacterium RIFOXYA2_FULL_50_26]|nr:MAG: hypothetical protein A2219_02925 [Elusimicrobia bacterium RIFOXYA2_FULL_50_26]OGS23107.1 MAG: hypothetical protein A2314_04675 [Elusimicrobia bacterium RIFOXYB2_FULL_50_12]